jgi:hypothetical protein
MQKSKEWFLDRIGKPIYRNSGTCNCDVCDEDHAELPIPYKNINQMV